MINNNFNSSKHYSEMEKQLTDKHYIFLGSTIKELRSNIIGRKQFNTLPLGLFNKFFNDVEKKNILLISPLDKGTNRKFVGAVVVGFGKFKDELLIGLVCKNIIDENIDKHYYIIGLSKNPYNFSMWCRLYEDCDITPQERKLYPELSLYVDLEKRKVSKECFFDILSRSHVPEEYQKDFLDTAVKLFDVVVNDVSDIFEDVFCYRAPRGLFKLYSEDALK
jgi:hypothetical protein